jgi:hypothetical protein
VHHPARGSICESVFAPDEVAVVSFSGTVDFSEMLSLDDTSCPSEEESSSLDDGEECGGNCVGEGWELFRDPARVITSLSRSSIEPAPEKLSDVWAPAFDRRGAMRGREEDRRSFRAEPVPFDSPCLLALDGEWLAERRGWVGAGGIPSLLEADAGLPRFSEASLIF